MLDATLSKKATLSLELEPGSIALGDRATITQVMMDLLTNASDALCHDQRGRPWLGLAACLGIVTSQSADPS